MLNMPSAVTKKAPFNKISFGYPKTQKDGAPAEISAEFADWAAVLEPAA